MPVFGQQDEDQNDQGNPQDQGDQEGNPDLAPRDGEVSEETVESIEAEEGSFVGVDPVYRNAAVPQHAPVDGDDSVYAEAAEREKERLKRDAADSGVTDDDDDDDSDED